jgi:3-methyladenine DNA glycosylase AlkD
MSPQLDEERRTNPTDKRRSSISLDHVMNEIKRRGKPETLAGKARFGIQTGMAFGVSIPQLRDLAKKTGTDHELAENSGRLESMRLAYSPA